MQVFADDGTRIDANVDGAQGSHAVILIHGFPLAREIWDTVREALARSYFVVTPDLRGFGKSSIPEGPYLMETLAADIAALLDALGVRRASLAGHSMGGYVALAFARMFSERVARLALVPSRLRADSSEQSASRRALADEAERDGSIEPVVAAYVPGLFAPDTPARAPAVAQRVYEIARRTAPRGAAAALRGMALRASSEDIAADLDIPTLMVAGGSDRSIPLGEAREIAASFARGRLVVCERSGHLPMLEEPDRVTGALDGWLNDGPD